MTLPRRQPAPTYLGHAGHHVWLSVEWWEGVAAQVVRVGEYVEDQDVR